MNITGGKYNGRRVLAPDENITRPTLSKVRMGVFNTLYSMLGEFEGKTFLDVFGGSGIMGLEAISRGFSDVVVFEKNKAAADIIKKNYESLGLVPKLKIGDSLRLLKNNSAVFDVVYIDPPYESGIYGKVFELINFPAIVIAEHADSIIFEGKTPVKEKNYGGKRVSFYVI